MKQVLIFSAICAAIFITGFAEAKNTNYADVNQYYAPKVSIGQFTSSLAGTERHVLDCAISLELNEQEGISSLVQSPGWMNRIRSEIFMLIKDRVYDDLAGAEGALQFAGDINRTFSAGGR